MRANSRCEHVWEECLTFCRTTGGSCKETKSTQAISKRKEHKKPTTQNLALFVQKSTVARFSFEGPSIPSVGVALRMSSI